MQNLTSYIFLLVLRVCTQPLHCSINFTSYVASFIIRCFSIKVISQAKGALFSANIYLVNNGWCMMDELKYLQGSHATVSTILNILQVASVLQYLLSSISCSVVACRILYFKVQGEQ